MKTLIQTAYGEPAQVLELREEPDGVPDQKAVAPVTAEPIAAEPSGAAPATDAPAVKQVA